MANKVVLLVHGMGTHKKGEIIKNFKSGLGDRAKSFGLDSSTLLKKVDYKEYNFSEKFDAIRKQFAENAQARAKGFKYLGTQGFAESLVTQLTNFEAKFGKDQFFYTHWLDVVLYGTMYFGEKLRVEFITEFDKLRKKYGHANIHIVCHSLGTALVHDALAKYYRLHPDPFDDIPDVKAGDFNIASLWTFANVSRLVNLLNDLTDPYQSTVKTGDEGCTMQFFNVRHRYDPFTWFKTYKKTMPDGSNYTFKTIRKVNTHDFYEYITEPTVASSLLSVIYDAAVSDQHFEEGKVDYNKKTLSTQVKDLKDTVDEAANDVADASLGDAITKFIEIKRKIEDLKKQFDLEDF